MNHISYGASDKLLPNITDAAILSGAHEFIMKLDNKYQTVLNNNGDNLSGGQKYRLDMARALLSNAPILILDEPTSALDYESKMKFVNTLQNIKKETDKIIIVITHDFSIMSIFDSIVLLKDGAMVTQSTHTKLINISSWYSNGISNFYEK
jgi:ABC-type bacteriocin/lantibiotic exporter with double-glycine peptidase domain